MSKKGAAGFAELGTEPTECPMPEVTIDISTELEIRLAHDGIEITQANGTYPGSTETVSLGWRTFNAVTEEAAKYLRKPETT